MRILFLTQRVPYPPNRGDKIPNFHYIRHLAKEHEIVVACLADGEQDLENVSGLMPFVESVEAVSLSRTRSRIRALAALTMSTRPLTVAYFDEPELRRRVRQRLNAWEFDLAIVCSSGMASYVLGADIPRIIQFTDLDSQKWKQYAANSRLPKNWIYEIEARRLLNYERRIAREFDYSLFCSARETSDFMELVPGSPVRCIRNGVDIEYFQPSDVGKVPDSLVFTGVMNYRPNVEGADWFCRQVFPLIRQQRPNATFTICGAHPTKKVRSLAQLPGVSVTGAVPDVRPYLARAAVAVVPMQLARGIQNKILEAMAMGLPVVTTTIAGAGIDAQHGTEIIVADTPSDFATATTRLLRSSKRRRQIGAAALAAISSRYRWEQSLAKLDDVIASVTSRGHAAEATASLESV